MEKNEALFRYTLRIADTSLVLGHRLSEWTGHGPMMEEELALANIALDLIGHANSLLAYAGKVEGKGRNEDQLAYLRTEREYYNTLLSEQPNGDYGFTIVRQLLHDAFDLHFYTKLRESSDETLRGLAEKALKESQYHLRHSASWLERLGQGTEESHKRVQVALNELWRFTDDLFEEGDAVKTLAGSGITVDMAPVKKAWNITVHEAIERAGLSIPANTFMQSGSVNCRHTEHLGYLLAEMQHLHRSLPGVTW